MRPHNKMDNNRNIAAFLFQKMVFCLFCFLLIAVVDGDLFAQSKKKKSKKKPAKKSGVVKNTYQDITTRYNRYFNAKIRYQEGVTNVNNDLDIDYNEILPVYPIKSGETNSASSLMDEVIKKTSLAIQLKPNSKWVDDCYLLLGKAYYVKGETDEAVNSFQYVSNKFGKSKRRSFDRRSKERQKQLKIKELDKLKKEKEKIKEEARKVSDAARELALKERAEAKKEREKDKKQREKERAKEKKERDKAQKERLKQREKDKKVRAKIKKQRAKIKAKNKKRKKQGKSLLAMPKYPEKSTSKSDDDKEEEAEEIKEEEKIEDSSKDTEAELAAAAEEFDLEEDEDEKASSIVQEGKGSEKAYSSDGIFGFLKHKLSKNEAQIWLARSYIDQELYGEANSVLDYIKNDKKFPKRLKGDLNRLLAHYELEKGNNANAIEALEVAAKGTKKREGKARLFFILGQLHQKQQNYDDALAAFKKVTKTSSDFDMDFQADINIIKTKMLNGDMSSDRAIAQLERLAKDGKNKDFQDQIYFAMAEIALENGDIDQAMAYLSMAAENSTLNGEQKALAYLKLADLNYDRERYLLASAYYDSTLTTLPKDYKDYDQVVIRKETLGVLAGHIKMVALQDSLQRIAKMSPAARDEFIDNLIVQLEKEARDKAQAEEEQDFLTDAASGTAPSSASGGQFYFYNESAKGKGFTDFKNRWGDRESADYWRLSSKLNSAGINATAVDTSSTSRNKLVDLAAQGELSKEMILAALPLTKELRATSDTTIVDALFSIGKIYRDKLSSNDKAVEAFDNLLDRFPKTKYSPNTHYYQYLLAQSLSNSGKEATHKNILLTDYPNSVFAKMLKDDNYLKTLTAANNELESYYEQTYSYYKQENFDKVISRIEESKTKFKVNPLQPKFDLLHAFVIGKTKNRKEYVAALEGIIVKYPEDEVKKKAEEILLYLVDLNSLGATNPATPKGNASKYKVELNKQHYFVVAFNKFSQQVSVATNGLSDFNQSNFSADKLKVNQMMLDPQNQIVLVKDFLNGEKAMLYYKTVQQNETEVFSGLDTAVKFFVISKKNFTEYFKQKDADTYLEFFIQNYN